MVKTSCKLSQNCGPWRMSPWSTGCSLFTFCCTVGLAAKRGHTVSMLHIGHQCGIRTRSVFSNAFSFLSRESSTASQCSTGAHAESIVATWYHMLYGGPWLPPSSVALRLPLAAGYPVDYNDCISDSVWYASCLMLFALFTEPMVDKGKAGRKLKEL